MRNFTSWFTGVSRTFVFRKATTLLITLLHLLLPEKLTGLLHEPMLASVPDITPLPNKARGFRQVAGRYIAAFMAVLFSWFSTSIANAQNAPLNCDKYYMLVGELVYNNGANTARTDVYQFGSSSALTSCKFESGGGGEGMCVDPDKNIAYIATCCDQGEIRIYNYNTASFETPIKLAGEDLLDVTLSANYAYLYVTTYNKVYRISTSSRTVVSSFSKANADNSSAKEFWGVAVRPNSGKVFFTTNWQFGNGTSTIEMLNADLSGTSTRIATAPSGFYYRGITFDTNSNVWAVLANNNNQADRLVKYTLNTNGTVASTTTYYFKAPTVHDGNASQGDVNPFDIAFGPGGDIYVTTFSGDCVTKITYNSLSANTSNGFSTYIQYQAGVSGKSITFVCGNFKCVCNAPVINLDDLVLSGGTCNGGTAKNNGSVTVTGLTYSSSSPVKADINEGTSYGTTPIYGAGSNEVLGSGQTTLTFTGLKPNTKYTIRVWNGKDACYTDITFTTPSANCCTNCISNNFVNNGDFASGNTNGWTKSPSTIDFNTSNGYVILNNNDYTGDYKVYQDITDGIVGSKDYTLTGEAASHNKPGKIAQIYLEAYNGSSLVGTSAKFDVVTDISVTGLLPFNIKYTLPSSTTKIRVVGYCNGRALKFDNIILSRCYDPTSLSLSSKADPNCNQADGAITVTASGGSGEYEYSLNNSTWQSSNVFTGLTQGTYTIYVKDVNTSSSVCKKNISVTLSCTPCVCISNNLVQNSGFDSNVNGWTAPNGGLEQSSGSSTGGFAILNNADATGDKYVYQVITDGVVIGKTYTLNALAATHSKSAPAIAQIYMEFLNASDAVIGTSSKATITNTYNGTLVAISPISMVAPSNTAKIRFVGYCNGRALKFDNVKITTCYDAVDGTLVKTDPMCNQSNGSITVTASGGSGEYEYSLNNSTWQSSNVFTGLAAGTYTIYIKDANTSGTDCKKSLPATLTCIPCVCESDNLVKNSGFDTNLDNWSPQNGGFERATGSSTGAFAILNNSDQTTTNGFKVYQVITNGVIVGKTYMLNALAATHSVSGTSAKAEIYFEFLNSSDGVIGTSAKATITNPYNGTLVAIPSISMVAPANTAKIRIVGYCNGRALKFDNVVIKTCYEAVGGSLIVTDIACGQTNGTVTVTATGGSGSYEYSSGGNIWQASNVFSLPAGSYTISIRDKNATNCVKTLPATLTAKPNPTVSVNTVKICLGETAVLTASGCNGTITWSGGGTPNGTTLSVKPTVAGTTTYTATCTASNGCTAQAVGTIMTYPLPTVTVNDIKLCAGETGTLTATGCSGTITWSGGGTPGGSTLSVNATGTYTATCKVTTNGKECSVSDVGTVIVNPAVSVSVNNLVLCVGESGTLIATGCSGTVTWSGGGTPGGSTLSVNATGTYTATCKVTANGKECSASSNGTVTVNPAVSVSVNDIVLCAGETGTLTATGCSGTITWMGGGTPGGSTLSVNTAGTYTATCKVTINGKECSATDNGEVKVNSKPQISVPDQQTCAGIEATLTASGCAGGTITWNTGGSGSSIKVTQTTAGTYTYTATCTITTNSKTCTNTATGKLIVNPNPTISVDSKEICIGQSATLTASTCTGTVSWNTGATGSTLAVSPAITTTYTATCTLSTTCKATANGKVTVNQLPNKPILTVDKSNICPSESATITASGCNGGTLLWSNGETTSSITVYPATTTTYTVTCTLTTTGCVSDPASQQISVTPTDPITITTCTPGTSSGNPTSQALGFNVFTLNGVVFMSGEVDNGVAAGGNIELKGTTNITGNNPSGYSSLPTVGGNTTFIYSGGKVIYTSGNGLNVNGGGFAKICNITGSTFYPNGGNARITGGTFDTTPYININTNQGSGTWQTGCGSIDFVGAFTSFQSSATSMSGLTNNITPTFDPGNTTQPKLTLQSGSNIWNLTGTQLNGYSTIVFNNAPDASKPLIVNVNTSGNFTLTLPNLSGIGDAQGQFIIWNFYNATNLTISNSSTTMKGTLFAPNADVTKNSSSNIDGQVIAKSFVLNGGEVHYQKFNSTIDWGTNCEPICAGSPITLTATGCTSTLTWTGGGSTKIGNSVVFNPTVTTVFTATCGTGNCKSTANITIEVVPTPTVTVNDLVICYGTTGTLTATGCTGTVTWNTGASGTSIIVSTAGTYTATCKLTTNGKECTASDTGELIINPEVKVTVNDVVVCLNETATLTATGCSGGTISWSNGGSGTSITVPSGTAGTYSFTATCTVTLNGKACSASDAGKVTVNPGVSVTVEDIVVC
ncbi:collagen-binding domain-containing protein, partial [Emticicia sp. BO119]|uniref:collagen-binding domain-containing protein n=1 Tax=Emticicia sp. BO119 TaxID=2757768 RepID=UPI0015F10BEA